MENDKRILALGASSGHWIVYMPQLAVSSLLGFLFWSAVIAAIRQVLVLIG